MSRSNEELKKVGAAHIIGAWLFLAASVVTGILGVSRMMSGATDRAAGGAGCVCLAILFAVIAAVLALLGIHQQNVVLLESVGPGFHGSHGSGDGSGDDTGDDTGGI